MEVTELAVEKLKEVMEEQGEQASSLRVIAMPAETGGVQYMLTMEKESQADDTEMNVNGIKFLMDADSVPFLEEATIDFCGSGGCGCGSGGGGCGCGSGGGGGGGGCGCGSGH